MAKSCYDFVVLDSPPALHVADSAVLAKLCQHIVFIVQAGRATKRNGRRSDKAVFAGRSDENGYSA